jgi:hypothetical protein
MRRAALNRARRTLVTRDKISANSSKALLFKITKVNSSPLLDGSMFIVLRTIKKVAGYCNCNEKTVRRATKGNGIIKLT